MYFNGRKIVSKAISVGSIPAISKKEKEKEKEEKIHAGKAGMKSAKTEKKSQVKRNNRRKKNL